MNLRQILAALAVSLVLLGFVLGACNSATGALPLDPEPFRNEIAGFSIRYPLGWKHEVECWGMGRPCYDKFTSPLSVLFAGTTVLVMWGPNNDDEPCPQEVSPRTLLELAWEADDDNEDAILLGIEDTIVDGQEAAFWDRTGKDATEPIQCQDRAVIVCMEGRIFSIQGQSDRALWSTFLPTFEAMLASMKFFEPETSP